MNYREQMENSNNLLNSCKRLKHASGWKYSTQRVLCNRLRTVNSLKHKIHDGTYKQGQGTTFRMHEYGHKRIVKALSNVDLLVQHTLCDKILTPKISPLLIYDNGASIKGKGISFSRLRLDKHLHDYYRNHGNEGYILLVDYRKFFDNIRHDKLLEMYSKALKDPWIAGFIRNILESYRIDISFTEDPDYISKTFNMYDYQQISKELLTGKRHMGKSLGIGSPISQISGIFFPLVIDNYIKTVLGCKYYGAFMDDRYLIHESKQYLVTVREAIEGLSAELGLHLNMKKTQIVKLSHGFTFLKAKYFLTDTGAIVHRIPRDTITRERRKLKKLAVKVVNGEMSIKEYRNQYLSWRGDKVPHRGRNKTIRYNSHRSIQSMDKTFRRDLEWIMKSLKKSEENSRKSSTSSASSQAMNQKSETIK